MTDPAKHDPVPRRRRPGPEFENFLRLDAAATPTSLTGRVLGALKPGAFLAIAVAIAFMYLDSYAGIRLERSLTSLAVLAALVGPPVLVAVRGLRERRRRAGSVSPGEDRPSGR